MIRMTEVCDAVQDVAQKEAKGDADAAAERIREQDGGEAFFSVVGDVRDMAEKSIQQIEKANGLRRERSAAQGREVVAALQNGTITQEDIDWMSDNASGIRLEDVCQGDTGYQTAVSAAEELLNTQLTDGLANGSIRAAIDRDYMYSGKFNAFSMGEENVAQDKAFALMSTGIGSLIRRDLNQDMLMAEICGMTLDDYYEEYPARNKSPEARVQAATEEYMNEWMEASDAFRDMLRLSDLTQATESIARSGGKMEVEEKLRERDAALAGDGADDSKAYVDPILSTFEGFVGGFANVVVVGTENFLIWAGNSFTSGNEDISDRLYDKYNGDAAAYVKDLKEYAEINPAMRDYIYAALDSNLNAFDIVVPGAGVALGIAGAKVQDQETFAQSSRYIAENGSAAVQFIYETSNMLGSTAAMMAVGSTGQAAGLPAKLATMVAELGEATGTVVDTWENGGNWSVAQHTALPLAALLGLVEGNQLTARVGDMIQGNGLTGLLARGRREAGFKGLITSLIKNPGETMKTLLAGARQVLGEGVKNGNEEVIQDALKYAVEEGVQAASGNQSIIDAIRNTVVGHFDDYIHTYLTTLAGEPFMEAGFGIAGKMSGVQMDAYDMDASAPIVDQVAAAEQSTVNGYSDARATNAWLDADAIQMAIVQEQDAITALAQGEAAAAVTEAQANTEAAHTDWLARRREENEASAIWTEATNRLSELTEQVIDADVVEQGMVAEMRDAQVAADNAGERYSAAQAATQQAEIAYQEANDILGTARAASKAQFDALMQPAIEAARQRALDNATRGMSDSEKARTIEYLDLDRQLADAEQNIREAERSAKDAPAGSDIERRAKSALVAARRIYDQITERMTEIFETTPATEGAAEEVRTAEAEAQTPAAVAKAQQAAQEAANAANADPTNARLQAEADIAAKNLALAQAQAQLDAERGGIAEGLRGSAQDRAAAVEKHRTLSGAVEAAASDLKAAQEKNARVDRTQQELADAIADLQNYSDDDLRNPDSENYGAAVAEVRLTQATRAADVAAAEAGVRDALSALDASNPDSVNAYRDALVRRTEVYQADLELTERQKAEIDRHVARVAEGSQRAQAILEARQRGDREQAANLLAAAWNESEGSPEVRAMLRAAAGIRTNASEVTIQNDTGATGKAGLTRAYSESAFNLSEDDQLQLQILDALAKDGNIEIVAHPTVSTVPGARNGVYFEGNTIHIGLDAIDHAYVQTGMHEIVHWLRGNNVDGYGGVSQVVFDALERAGEDVDALIREKLAAYAKAGEMLDYEAAQEEVVAESAALVLTDQKNMRNFAREHADAFSAFRDAFMRFWEKLQTIARSVAGKNRTGEQQALIGQSKALQRIYDVLMDAVKAAGEQGSTGENVIQSGEVKYSMNPTDAQSKHIRQQIAENADLLNEMQPVFDDTVALPEYKGRAETTKWVIETLEASGYSVDREGFGTVLFGKRQLKRALGYLNTDAEIAAFAALPYVFSNGVQIYENESHKGRNNGTVTFAAPVVLNGIRGNMAASVVLTTDNFYRTHRIVMPDGSVFEFVRNEKAESTSAGGVAENSSLAARIDSASNGSNQLEQSVGVQFPKKLSNGASTDSVREYTGEVKLNIGEENSTGQQGSLGESATTEQNAAYSLNVLDDGTKFVNVDKEQADFDGLTVKEMQKVAYAKIKALFPAGTYIGDTNQAKVVGTTAGEYTHPANTKKMAKVMKGKMRASTELGNLLEAGTYVAFEEDGKYGKKHANTKGFEYYATIFKVGEEWFEGTVNVRVLESGDKLFHDVTGIKNITESIAGRYGSIDPHAASLSDKSILPQKNGLVNSDQGKRFSLNSAIIDDYNREQFVNTAVEQIMESGSRAPAIMRALARMGEGARYAYAPNGGTGGGGEYANGTRGVNPNGAGAEGGIRNMRNPIEITTDLVRSVNAGLNPSGAKTVNGRGHMSRAVAGFYAPRANYITTDRRYAGQLAVNLHEFGHAISQTQDFNAVPPGYDGEYAAFLSQYPAEARGQETIAAFAADYLVEPQRARSIAGDAYVDDFEAMLRANPRLNAAIQKARTEIDLWKSATVAERVANSIRDADEAETRSTARSRSLIRRFYGAVFDAADVAKDVGNDLYTAVRYANASGKRADTILTDRMVDYQGNRVGDSLADVLRKAGVHQDNEMDMLTYAVARHAIEWYNEGLARRAENPNASGMEVFADGEVSINDLRALVAEYERTNPTAVQGADALVGWWREFRDTWYARRYFRVRGEVYGK